MFGYVLPSERRLSEADRTRFRAVYCGLCHTLGKRYGTIARFLLNYDFTILAILLSDGKEFDCKTRRCIVHPCRGCTVCPPTTALEAAADRSVILSWWQIHDHIVDCGFWNGLKYRVLSLFLRRAYRKAAAQLPAFDTAVRGHLAAMDELERAHCASIDAAADPFAALMADAAADIPDERRRRILEQLLYQLGRWIYLVDAADDFKEDARHGSYNPLRYRYQNDGEELTAEDKLAAAETLDASIVRMSGAYALCNYGVWTPILDSIFYESLYGIGRSVLDGTYHRRRRLHANKEQKKHEDAI